MELGDEGGPGCELECVERFWRVLKGIGRFGCAECGKLR